MAYNSSYLGTYSKKIVRSFNLLSFMILKGTWDNYDFMNLGYIGNTLPFVPDDKDKVNYTSISLYAKTLEGIPSDIQTVLEIGSGLGGGCYLFKKYYKFPDVTGIDYARLNVLYCNRKFRQAGLQFIRCAAEKADSLNKKYDLIISLEAAVAFYDWEAFFNNVAKLMNDKAVFAYADLMAVEDKTIIEQLIDAAGLQIKLAEEISDGVILSLYERPAPNKDKSISYKFWEKLFFVEGMDKFDAYNNSNLHKKLINKELIYMKYLISKK